MRTKRTESKAAITKLVKLHRIILQTELAKELNKANVNHSCEALANEGKFKREKIKSRGKVGNLVSVWVVYANSTPYNDVLDFERELINRPFESPLKENHCYKMIHENSNRGTQNGKIGRPRKVLENTSVDKIEVKEATNVVDMQNYVKINNTDVGIKMFNNDRVVTANEIAQLHNREIKRVNEQLEHNIDRFKVGVDFHILSRLEAKVDFNDFEKYFTSPRQNEIYLYTEKGYLKLTKTFTDDLSWDIQDMLIDNYFRMKEIKEKVENNVPVVPNDFAKLEIMENMIHFMKEQNSATRMLNKRVENIESFVDKFRNIAQ